MTHAPLQCIKFRMLSVNFFFERPILRFGKLVLPRQQPCLLSEASGAQLRAITSSCHWFLSVFLLVCVRCMIAKSMFFFEISTFSKLETYSHCFETQKYPWPQPCNPIEMKSMWHAFISCIFFAILHASGFKITASLSTFERGP